MNCKWCCCEAPELHNCYVVTSGVWFCWCCIIALLWTRRLVDIKMHLVVLIQRYRSSWWLDRYHNCVEEQHLSSCSYLYDSLPHNAHEDKRLQSFYEKPVNISFRSTTFWRLAAVAMLEIDWSWLDIVRCCKRIRYVNVWGISRLWIWFGEYNEIPG